MDRRLRPSAVSTGGGRDVIYTGGAFGDTLAGGTGAGHHVLRNTQVQVIELPGGGEDTAWVEVDGYTIAADVEIGRL